MFKTSGHYGRKFFYVLNRHSGSRVFVSTPAGKYDIINGYEKRKQMYNLHGLRKMLRGI